MQEKTTPGGLGRHALLMILCCAIPLALLAAVALFRIDLGSIGSLAFLLLCPLLHIGMMWGMRGGHHGKGCHEAEPAQQPAVQPKR